MGGEDGRGLAGDRAWDAERRAVGTQGKAGAGYLRPGGTAAFALPRRVTGTVAPSVPA